MLGALHNGKNNNDCDAKPMSNRSCVALLEKGEELTAVEMAQVMEWIETMSPEQLQQVLLKVHDVRRLVPGGAVDQLGLYSVIDEVDPEDEERMYEDLLCQGRATPVILPPRRIFH
jgi:hypothetical protein